MLDGRMRIALDDFAAESGATIQSMAPQLEVFGPDTDLVTLSIGHVAPADVGSSSST